MNEDRMKATGQPSEQERASKRTRRPYSAPSVIEYGSIARLTHTGGSTAMEGGTPRVRIGCL